MILKKLNFHDFSKPEKFYLIFDDFSSIQELV